MGQKKKGQEKKMVKLSESDPNIIICPKCNGEIDHLIRHGKKLSCVCPKCKAAIGLSTIPEDIYEKFVKREDAKVKNVYLDGEKEKEPDINLLERMRDPEEILEKVLRKFKVTPKGIKILKDRSRTVGGLMPEKVADLLMKISGTGVNDKVTAEFIQEDYELNLSSEKRLSYEKKFPITHQLYHRIPPWGPNPQQHPQQYPPQLGGYPPPYPQYDPQGSQQHPPQYPPQYPQQQYPPQYPQQQYPPYGNGGMDVRIHKVELEKQKEKYEHELKMQKLENSIKERNEDSSSILNVIKAQHEDTMTLIKTLSTGKDPNEEGKKEMEKKLEKMEEKFNDEREARMKKEVDFLESRINDLKELRNDEKKDLNKKLSDLREDIKHSRPSGESYTDDTYRLISDGMDKLSQAVEKRHPVKDAGKIIMDMDEGAVKKGKFKANKKIESETDIEDLIDEDYIEEEEEEEDE